MLTLWLATTVATSPLLLAACGESAGEEPFTERAVESGFRVVRNLSLEENREVINVSPRVNFDPQGGFLVADYREAQLRRYSSDGDLLWVAGRKGEGPEEYYGPRQLVRLPSGELLAIDFDRKFVIYSDSGAFLRTVTVPFAHVHDVEILEDTALLVSATLGRSEDTARLHLWSLTGDSILNSFFFPFQKSENEYAADLMAWVSMDVRGDTIAAVFPAVDSVFFFTANGQRLSAIGIPSSLFRAVPAETPDDVERPPSRANWLSTFDIIQDVHYLSDGDLLLQYFDYSADDPTLATTTWHWLLYDRDGRGFHRIPNSSRLLTVDTQSDSLLFVTPGSEVPNKWSIAHAAR